MARKNLGTGLDLGGQRIQNLADGSAAADAVTKNQLDAAIRGAVVKASVKVATTAAITLSGTQTIDGVAVVAGDRVLVKDQGTASANGIYVVAAGSWSRATDFDDAVEVKTAVIIPVEQGTAGGDKNYQLVTDGTITVGSSSLAFTAIGGSGASYTAGNGLSLSGSQFSVVPKSGGGLVVDGTGVGIDSAYAGAAKRYAAAIGDGAATSISVTHGLGTTDVVVQVRNTSTGEVVDVDLTVTSATVVTLGFATAPAAGAYRVVVLA